MSEEHAAAAPAEPVTPAEPVAPAAAPLAPEPAAAPVETPPPAPEPAAEPAAAEPPQPKPGFLTAEPEPAAEPTAAEEPKTEGEPAPAVEEPKYEFTLPEGVTLNPEQIAPLTKWLHENGVPPGEKAQALLDMHLGEMRQLAEHALAEQRRAFDDTVADKLTEAMADPTFGGAGFQTNVTAIGRAMSLFMPNQDERRELFRRLDASGMSNDLFLGKMLLNVARRFAEPTPPPPNPTPLLPREAAGRAPRGGRSAMYTFPRGNSRTS